MKRSANLFDASLIDTTNSQSPKRSCIQRTENFIESDSANTYYSLSDDALNIDDNIQSLISMGFVDPALNRKALIKAGNDINEAVTILTSSNYFNDIIYQTSEIESFKLINSIADVQYEQQQPSQKISSKTKDGEDSSGSATSNMAMDDGDSFASKAFLELELKLYSDDWTIQYKREEALGQCLLSARALALIGEADQNKQCVKFMEVVIPDIFRKIQCSPHVNNLAPEIQSGIFDMVELLVDLIAARLSYIPVPVKLLETLSILFDCNSTFHRKHRSKSYDRSLYEKQLGGDALANPPSTFSISNRYDSYGWLCQIINRFVSKDGIINLKRQFENNQSLTALELNVLLSVFVNCMDYVILDRYRQLFNEHIEQALDYIKKLTEDDLKRKSVGSIFDLLLTLRKICSVAWPARIEQLEELHLNTLFKMISSSNFNAKMNCLKELAKLIEHATTNVSGTMKTSIQRDVISEWITKNSILSKAFEGNIDQNQYVDKIRIVIDFIASKISKEDIETIWKMQHGRSSVAVDHLLSLIASAAAKFNLQQLNYLIEFIYASWKKETVLMKEKLVEVLGSIGKECQKDCAARVLTVLWDMAHEDRLSRSMLEHILYCHLRIFQEGRFSYDSLKREYCLKCVDDLQRKQGWLVPAIKHLYDLLYDNSTSNGKRTDQDLISALVNKNDVIFVLIQSLSKCQLDVWDKTRGDVRIDTLVDGRFTHEESIKSHLDLISFLLKRGNVFLVLKHSECLWDTLVTNEKASSFDNELGLNWFIQCIDDINCESQVILFEKRVSKLNPIDLTSKGYECFKLYFEKYSDQKCHFSKRNFTNTNLPVSINNEILEIHGIDELWNIILNVGDENIAKDATYFLLDLYYLKQPYRLRSIASQPLYEYFLNEVYLRLSLLLCQSVSSCDILNSKMKECCKSLKIFGEQLSKTKCSSSTNEIHLELWLQKIERLLMITEEYIRIVEREHSPEAHITSFYGLEYQIKFTLNDTNKTNSTYDILTVHSNDTIEKLRLYLAQYYKVPSHDIHLSIKSTRSLPPFYDQYGICHNLLSTTSNNNIHVLSSSYNSKYLYQLHIKPGTRVYVKILGLQSNNSSVKTVNNEPLRLNIDDVSLNVNSKTIYMSTNDISTRLTPSNMMGENCKLYDILYKLSCFNTKSLNKRIRNLLSILPSDNRIHDYLDHLSTNTNSDERSPTVNNRKYRDNKIINDLFDVKTYSLIQLLYNFEILSCKINPKSKNDGIQHSSKLFREDFVRKSGVKYLLQLLYSLNCLQYDDPYQYSLYQEITLIILQLIQLFVCGDNKCNDLLKSTKTTTPSSQIKYENINETTDSFYQPTIEQLNFDEFVQQMKQLIFLCWAAAAGDIRLHEQNVTINKQIQCNRDELLKQIDNSNFSRSNNQSPSSNRSSTNENQSKIVQYGICVKTQSISSLDSEIAMKIIEIIKFCFEKRPEFIASFLIQPFFADFLLEILMGTTSYEIRQHALTHIISLCQIDSSICDVRSIIHKILLKARLPLWSSSSNSRHSYQKLLEQSNEYFDLRCHLSEHLTIEQQNMLNINAKQLLTEELNWLTNYTVSSTSNECRQIDNILFTGHLKFIRTLLTCEDIKKDEFGKEYIHLLIEQFLFPASKCQLASTYSSKTGHASINDESVSEPKFSTSESRLAAYDVLVELVRSCKNNFKILTDDLINLHHRSLVGNQIEWEQLPQVYPRASCGLVGLYNGGATCYMNSILQQFFMLPQISERILSIHDDSDNSNLFHQLQQVFGHLLESKMQYYCPESFWKVFRLWGQEINIREQQDAFDFFISMTDQIDEYLKSIKQDEIFHKQFGGVFSNQIICTNGCHHRYEGEEKFMALNVAVKVESLDESLNQFVKGELLDGTNSYFCEKCQEKRTAIKRLCIKKLPPLLCIQMKRFGFDWENTRALKFDDYFKFPFILNMEPFTTESVNKRENFQEYDENLTTNSKNDNLVAGTNNSRSISRKLSSLNNSSQNVQTINYELIGIVIHSGEANAGHYYSFIKDIRSKNKTHKNQWYRFNDGTVDEIQLTEQILEEECFGGTFRVQKDNHSKTMEDRTRFWNAYILIYQCIESSKLLLPPVSTTPMSPLTHKTRSKRESQHDSLSQLAALVVQSETRDLFQTNKSLIPSNVLACVKQENLEFLKNRDTYCDDYFEFIYNLSNTCLEQSDLSNTINNESCYLATKLLVHFLFHSYFKLHRHFRKNNLQQFIDLLKTLFVHNSISCETFYKFLFEKKSKLIKLYLLDCPTDEIRKTFKDICQYLLESSYKYNMNNSIDTFIEQLISLLDKSVIEQIKHSQYYFQLIYAFINMNDTSIEYLIKTNLFTRLIVFLLGENIDNRRWTSGQAKDFGIVHEIISILALSCYENNRKEYEHMKIYFYGKWSNRYTKEICYAFQEVSTTQLTRTLQLIETLTTNDTDFSKQFIKICLQSIHQAHINDLKSLFKLLNQILLINDSLQIKRLQLTFEGIHETDENDRKQITNGLYTIIQTSIENEQRRVYQALKFLINLSNASNVCKEYFYSTANQWEAAIIWLKQQMQSSWQLSPAQNLSNEDNDARSFQRTRSAQFTLEQAQSLLQRKIKANINTLNNISANEPLDVNDNQNQSIAHTMKHEY